MSGESATFSRDQMNGLLDLAEKGVGKIINNPEGDVHNNPHKEGKPEHDCADVERRNEEKNWKKKKAKKNCKKKSADGVKADKACKCQACDSKRFKKKERKEKTKTGSVVIAVPVCVAGVFLIGGTILFFKKKKTHKTQRRLSHRDESMPTITPPKV